MLKFRLVAACVGATLCSASSPPSSEYHDISLAEYSRLLSSAVQLAPGEYAFAGRITSYDVKALPNATVQEKLVMDLVRKKMAAGPSLTGKLCLAGAAGAGISGPLDPSACRVETLKINGSSVETVLTCRAFGQHREFRTSVWTTYRTEGYSFRASTNTVLDAGARRTPVHLTSLGDAHRVGACSN